MALNVEKVGSIPTSNPFPGSYNMQPIDNINGDCLFFLDQKLGLIYSYDTVTHGIEILFDITTDEVPAGLNLDWTYDISAWTYKVKAMTQGPSEDEIVLVFTSTTLPEGWDGADAPLPPSGAYSQYGCDGSDKVFIRDIYRMETTPPCFPFGGGINAFNGFEVFVKYTMNDGKLEDPHVFFVSEVNSVPSHLGGRIATTPEGILYSTGDSLVYGLDGSYAPQLDHETSGKILLIDPNSRGQFKIVAKGVRNSQQMRVVSTKNQKSQKGNKKGKSNKKQKGTKNAEDLLFFMDIGGVTAEEVNVVPLKDLLENSEIENFGWGRNLYDGKAREGTFYIEPGKAGVFQNPKCEEEAPSPENGYIQPWIQFGRTETDFFHAISSFAIPTNHVEHIKILCGEMNTGQILGTDESSEMNTPVKAYKLKLYYDGWGWLENGLNDLVLEELGEVGYYRGDPRVFHYPDGTAGVFIERTGAFYKLSEIEAPIADTPVF